MRAMQRSRSGPGCALALRVRVATSLGALLALLLIAVLPAAAQPLPELPGAQTGAAVAEAAEPTSRDAIATRRAALAAELGDVEEALAATSDPGTRAHLGEVRDRLHAIDSLLRKQAELAGAPRDADPSRVERVAEGAPSILALNELYEAQDEIEARRRWLAEALTASRNALAAAREKLDAAEKERRAARSTLEAAQDPSVRAEAERALRLRQLASRTAQERVHLRTLETRLAASEQEATARETDLAERIASMRAALARRQGESDALIAALAAREGEIRRDQRAAERSLATLELRLEAAQRRFASQSNPSRELLEEVDALAASRDAIRQQISLLDTRLERLDAQRTTWQRWLALVRDEAPREELPVWSEELAGQVDSLAQAEVHHEGLERDLERRLEGIQARLARGPENARTRPALEEQRTALARTLDVARAEAADLAADSRLSQRVLGEIHDRTGRIDPLEYLARAMRAAQGVWSYEITTVDDAPITVGSLVLALVFFGAGLWAARHGSGFVGRLATDRFGLDSGAAHAFQTLSFYVLLVSFTLLALRAVHFPLTAFTVLGGALAIGIGFGSQNVMNNFISGLILMLERPVRARDVVEVDGNHGTIENIGARSTQIRSTDGRHIVVPNSFFLENNVVNWTLSDDLIRAKVTVGVIYGSPTRLVEQLIRRVVDEDEQVLAQPEPIIVFEEFGDNSLNFDAYFWVNARSPMQVRQVQSRVRFRIDDLFREHDLVIAFPQRDVHLDTTSPIEVRLVSGGGEPPRSEDG